jgi:23S rRNA (pseudouridine1915-N3)-methyltransferase
VKITILCIGKTGSSYLKEGIDIYLNRLKHYAKVEYKELPDVPSKGIDPDILKLKEGELILKNLKSDEVLILLDEKGYHFSSRGFSEFLQKKMNAGTKGMCLVIGGAYGFSDPVYTRANAKISFSKMTFSHEMIRLLLTEQLYRAFTILKGESYHHD